MRTVLFLAAAAALAAPLVAQPPAPGADRPHFDPAQFEQRRAEMRARHAADLAIVLALKPAQKHALDQWLVAMEPGPRGDRKGPPPAPDAAPATTPERLERDSARIAERQQNAAAKIEATKHFYATLDPQQRQVFDALGRLRHGEGFDGGRRGGPKMGRGPAGDGPPPPPAQGM